MDSVYDSLYPQKVWNILELIYRRELRYVIQKSNASRFQLFGIANRFLELTCSLHMNKCKIHKNCSKCKYYIFHSIGNIIEIISIYKKNIQSYYHEYEFNLPILCNIFNELNISDIFIDT